MWNDLTMQQRADVISMAVKSGFRDIDSIRKFYNESLGSGREYKKGGALGRLNTLKDIGYSQWKERASKYKRLNIDEDKTYDYEGWYNENPSRAWAMLNDSPDAHFNDRYKTVYHPTFSNESIYSGRKHPLYNPKGLQGGTWNRQGTAFTMSEDGYRGPVSMDERAQYLIDAENNGVQLLEADSSLPKYDNVTWGGVLPGVTVKPRSARKHSNGGSLRRAHMYPDGGDTDKTPTMNTTGGAGYVPPAGPSLSEIMYKNVSAYDGYDLGTFLHNLSGGKRALVFSDDSTIDTPYEATKAVAQQKIAELLDPASGYDENYKKEHLAKYRGALEDVDVGDELYATYLGIPVEQRRGSVRLQDSPYREGAVSLPVRDDEWQSMINKTRALKIGRNISSKLLGGKGIYRHAIGRGYDDNGEYVSYGDSYDLNPFRGAASRTNIPFLENVNDLSLGLFNPVEIYGRKYLNDFYGVPKSNKALFLPEVTVNAKYPGYYSDEIIFDPRSIDTVPTGITDKLTFKDGDPYQPSWQGKQLMVSQLPNNDFMYYDPEGRHVWKIPISEFGEEYLTYENPKEREKEVLKEYERVQDSYANGGVLIKPKKRKFARRS